MEGKEVGVKSQPTSSLQSRIVKTEAANLKLRIIEMITIGMMVFALAFIGSAGGPLAFVLSGGAMAIPLVLLRWSVSNYASSSFPMVAGALAFAIVVTGYIVRFYIAQELDAPRVAASIVNGTAPPPAQAGLAGFFIPISAFFSGGAAYAVVALVSLALHGLFARHRR